MVEGVDHVAVGDAVFASTRGDQWRIHGSQVSLENVWPQVTLPWSDGSSGRTNISSVSGGDRPFNSVPHCAGLVDTRCRDRGVCNGGKEFS